MGEARRPPGRVREGRSPARPRVSIGDGRRPRRSCRGSPARGARWPRRCSRGWVDRSGSTYRGGSALARGGDGGKRKGQRRHLPNMICVFVGGEKDRVATRDWPGLTRGKECSLRVEGFLGATWLKVTGWYRRVSLSRRGAGRRGAVDRIGWGLTLAAASCACASAMTSVCPTAFDRSRERE